jgi:hypothetical protein
MPNFGYLLRKRIVVDWQGDVETKERLERYLECINGSLECPQTLVLASLKTRSLLSNHARPNHHSTRKVNGKQCFSCSWAVNNYLRFNLI